MHQKVETEEQRQTFQTLYRAFTLQEAKYDYIEETGTEQYLLMRRGKAIGTVEFSAWQTDEPLTILKKAELLTHPVLLEKANDHLYIIGKLSLIREERGKGLFLQLMAIVEEHKKTRGANWYAGVMNEPLYHMLKEKGVAIEQIGSCALFGELTVIPFLLNARQENRLTRALERRITRSAVEV